MRHIYFFIILFLLSCSSKKQESYLGVSITEIEKATLNHLNDWFPRVIDHENGGYYTNFEYDWKRSEDQQKMIVTQARNLWTASKATQLYPNNELYKNAAEHGFNFITQKMWDTQNGGFFLNFNHEDIPDNSPFKLIYGNTFALYAIAEYAKINPSEEVVFWLNKTFDWIDSAAHDHENLGYFNIILNKELNADTPEKKAAISNTGWGNPLWKDQNTSIHLLEAFTAAYQVMPSEQIKTRLEEMLVLVRDTMTQANGSLKLYFTQNWQPINYSDSSRTFILENQLIDHVSFGHNIETAYLLIDASEKLYGAVDSATLIVAKKLTDHSLKYGFAPNYNGIFDKGYVFDNDMEIINRNKTWWAQAEAVHTLALMSRYFPEEELYVTAFQNMWSYMQIHLLDREHGGYYSNGIDETPESIHERKAYAWKGPYHDGRSLMQIMEYAKRSCK